VIMLRFKGDRVVFRFTVFLAVLAVLLSVGQLKAGPIATITARNSHGLLNGVEAYEDRTNQTWINLPTYLVGADYVQMANADKRNPDLKLDIEFRHTADLYLFVNDVTYGGGPIPWMVDGTLGFRFADTGDNPLL